MTLGENIRKIRKSKKISINKLAQISGLSQGYLSEIENNKANPTMDIVNKIARALGTTPTQLTSESDACYTHLYELCVKEDLTIDALCNQLGIDMLSVEMIKDNCIPSDNSLELIAKHFNVSIDYLTETDYSENEETDESLASTRMIIDKLIENGVIKDGEIEDWVAKILLNALKEDINAKLGKEK